MIDWAFALLLMHHRSPIDWAVANTDFGCFSTCSSCRSTNKKSAQCRKETIKPRYRAPTLQEIKEHLQEWVVGDGEQEVKLQYRKERYFQDFVLILDLRRPLTGQLAGLQIPSNYYNKLISDHFRAIWAVRRSVDFEINWREYCNMYLTILQYVSYPIQYYIDSSAEFICLSIALMITGRAATTITWDLE